MNDYQLELLGILQEECAEVIQIISKIRRFGLNSFDPVNPEDTNRDLFNLEVGDVKALIEMIMELPDSVLDHSVIKTRVEYKKKKVLKFLNCKKVY
jgi:hypothetical protein